ncbi:MAG: DUF447 family protein [Planctomycetales bacterium]|nr:DUF447 family protein [Planctomycetales bacterium]
MILEGIVTTINCDGTLNVSPMGPIVENDFQRITLRPFKTSTTYRNLTRTREGVLHVTDDVLLMAQAAVGQPEPPPKSFAARRVNGQVLADTCRWYEFRVTDVDDADERTRLTCDIVHAESLRAFWGFNRAKHAVLEAAILATRLHILPAGEVHEKMQELTVLVEKTGGRQEHLAFRFLLEYIERRSC